MCYVKKFGKQQIQRWHTNTDLSLGPKNIKIIVFFLCFKQHIVEKIVLCGVQVDKTKDWGLVCKNACPTFFPDRRKYLKICMNTFLPLLVNIQIFRKKQKHFSKKIISEHSILKGTKLETRRQLHALSTFSYV
jgi:hypothetical protein